MAGFLGLGGSSESYFLEPDDAKTMGDIDYMRTPKKVKRTFAKTKGWGDVGASEKTVSAYDERGGEARSAASTPSYTPSTPSYSAPATPSYTPATPSYTPAAPAPAPAAEAPPEPTVETPREPAPAPTPAPSSGDGMDMFRAMARKMR